MKHLIKKILISTYLKGLLTKKITQFIYDLLNLRNE